MTGDPIGACAARVAAALAARGETVAIAESTTGGRVCAALLALPGASAWFRGGVVVYTPASRRLLLGIEAAQVRHLEPLSEPMARHFAEAARERLQATWGLAELGVAGPTGVRYGPAGTCVIAVAGPRSASLRLETGLAEREANMRHFTDAALRLLAATVGHAAGPEQGA